jgi:plastocyanin
MIKTLCIGAALVLALSACKKSEAPAPAPAASADAALPTPVAPEPASPADAAPAPARADAAPPTGPSAADASTASAPTTPAPGATTGTITGKVLFAGKAPAMPALDRSRDPKCAQDEARATWLVVGAGGGVRDAVVRLPNGAAAAAKPTRPAFVDQKGCIYKPFMQVVLAGAKVSVRNSDPTNHNVRGVGPDDDILWNEMHLEDGPDKLLAVDARPGEAVQLKCDVHPWMETWVFVTDHPYAAVTAGDGTFKLERVPAGEYELEVWHPHLGKKTTKVKVEAGKSVEAKFPAFAPADVKAPE